ncbi:PLP-dependent aminotransferase family protein [Nonomuraea sp. K274]|uniref:PLP-dependent aminotransferase family protein n=1 Tax=Nonomuraea cypriaca TaxID=1187855 RepID=A0A931AJI2_9ACTN|nr:PLP-dependent aminotransferase family protein [Nonomuraea cypriaca]MBF8191549.1 PLP-dependent aminotransferase family protein [Nonomuraea cypriaca]
MDFHVTLHGRGDLGGQIYRQIRAAILDGRLRPGEPLSPSRELAQRLAVSRNTVTGAYDRLVAEEFAESRIGAGTYVRAEVSAPPRRGAPFAGSAGVRPVPVWSQIQPPEPEFLSDDPEYDLRTGIPDIRLFPYEAWRRLITRELRASAMGTGMHSDPAGLPRLRASIARHVGVSRGVRVTPEDLVVTQGIQQALDLVGRVLLRPGDCVAVEDPGYPTPRALFRTLGAEVVGVGVDAEGLLVDALPAQARIVYVTPSHQFPLGMPMSLERRLALLEWAASRDAVVIEDDYDTEFRYGGRPIEPLHSLDTSGQVVYVGTFSKVMLPVLRLGFMVAPASLRHALRAAKFVTDWHSPQPTQAALSGFIDEGLLARHIRRMRREYQARYERIASRLAQDFGDTLSWIPSAAGLHMAAWTAPGLDARAITRRARSRGVGVYPLSRFQMVRGRPDGLVFGYGAIPLPSIDKALDLLQTVLDDQPSGV